MDYAQASATLQDYTGQPLLESLETVDAMDDLDFDDLPHRVQSAHRILMAGFYQMFHGK